jgi:hypothetical protein
VGRPWGKTALLTGYNALDLLFGPSAMSTTRRFPMRAWSVGSVPASARRRSAEFLRAWRVEGNEYAIAQTLRPRFGLDAELKQHWTLSASGAWSSGRSFHAYDNVTRVSCSRTRANGAGAGARLGDGFTRLSREIFFRSGSSRAFTIFPDKGIPRSFRRRSSLFDAFVFVCACSFQLCLRTATPL